MKSTEGTPKTLTLGRRAGLITIAAVSFHLAFVGGLAFVMLGYFFALAELTRASTARAAFRTGLILGLLVFVPKLTFFYNIFGVAAVALWLILAFWHGLFVALGRWARSKARPQVAALLLATLWTGLEYFRSELYYLKFSWFAPGYAFHPILRGLGVYGMGFVLMLQAAALSLFHRRILVSSILTAIVAIMLTAYSKVRPTEAPKSDVGVKVAGMQLEFPVELEVPAKLDELNRSFPKADILVLSEYTFDGPLPAKIKAWCKTHSKYLVVGAKEMVDATNFYNTAYVIGPDGEVVFKQAKSVPIQFFKDGLPAREQNVWESPWGKIGICICYDLSYRRVVDGLVRKGAKALIVPTMDVIDWGRRQHELHALIAPTRAAEYGIPIFRVASSGFSQVVLANGKVAAAAPSPGQGAIISGNLPMDAHPSLPVDATLGPMCVAISGLVLIAALIPKPKTA